MKAVELILKCGIFIFILRAKIMDRNEIIGDALGLLTFAIIVFVTAWIF